MTTDECIKQLKGAEEALINLQYPTSLRCADIFFFLAGLRNIGQTIVQVREGLESEQNSIGEAGGVVSDG
jgi:hypothetical protein